MPVVRYLIFVGGILAALLFIPGWLLPKPPTMFADQSVALDSAVIRIRSAQMAGKGHSGSGQLTITPPVVMDLPTIQSSIPLPSDEAPDQPNLEAVALLKPDMQPAVINHSTQKIKRGAARPVRSRRAARGPVIHHRTVIGEDCCQFEWIGSG